MECLYLYDFFKKIIIKLWKIKKNINFKLNIIKNYYKLLKKKEIHKLENQEKGNSTTFRIY